MTCTVKICGLMAPEAVDASVYSGASMVGFIFFPPSPRSLSVSEAAALTTRVPASVTRVALSVDADDSLLDEIATGAGIDMMQLHGRESLERVTEIRQRYGLKIMKAVAIATREDVIRAHLYEPVVDHLMFDAKPPKDATRPGGNAVSFDWSLIAGETWSKPWVLAGGLTTKNVGEAIRISGAKTVDVSSSVESSPGVKNLDKIRAFVMAANAA